MTWKAKHKTTDRIFELHEDQNVMKISVMPICEMKTSVMHIC